MIYCYELAQEFYYSVSKLCKPDCYNLVLHKHLGDIFYTIGAKQEFEETYNAKLHFIIRPQHEFLMHIYQITDYSIYDLDLLVRKNTCFKNNYFDGIIPDAPAIDRLENEMFQVLFSCVPIKGEAFVCENVLLNNFFHYPHFWAYRWMTNMGLDEYFRFSIPKLMTEFFLQTKEKIRKIAPLEKIVLFAPEASTAIEFAPEFWNIIAKRVHAHGYKIIVNSEKFKIAHGISAFELGLSLQDVVSLGLSCAYVFSLRSGLCDVLVGAREKLYVFYPAMLHREMNGLNKCFEPKPNVNEIAVWKWKIDSVLWEGEDLALSLQKHINNVRFSYIKEKIKFILTCPLKSCRDRYKFKYRTYLNMAGKSKVFPENNKENIAHNYHNQKISLLGLPIYSRKYSEENQRRYTVRYSILGGVLQLKLFNDSTFLRLRFLGLQIFYRGEGKNKLFGINIYKFNDITKWLDKVQSKIDKKYDDIYFIRHNIGESYVELMLLAETIKVNQSKKPLLILWDKKYTDFYSMFLPQNMDMQFIDLAQITINTVFSKDTIINHKNQRFICSTPLIAQNMKKLLPTWPSVNFYDYITKATGIPKGAVLARPKSSSRGERKVENKIKQIELEDNFIILCPEANSLVKLENRFWQELATSLQKKGYDIFVNAYDKDITLENIKTARMTIEEMYILAKRSQGIISLASGLSVFLTAAGVKMDLLYTKFTARSIGYDAAMAMQIYSVHHLPGVSQSLVKEYNASKINNDELIDDILKRY